jgi:ribosomal protein L24E
MRRYFCDDCGDQIGSAPTPIKIPAPCEHPEFGTAFYQLADLCPSCCSELLEAFANDDKRLYRGLLGAEPGAKLSGRVVLSGCCPAFLLGCSNRRGELMPLRMVLETGAKGEQDLYCPQLFCDYCGEQIEAQGNGLYQVRDGEPVTGEIFFTHKHCNHAFEHFNRPAEGARWYWVDARDLPLQLAANLGMGRNKREVCETITKRFNFHAALR